MDQECERRLSKLDAQVETLRQEVSDLKASDKQRVTEYQYMREGMSRLESTMNHIDSSIQDVAKNIGDSYVTKTEMMPYKRVFWIVGTAVITAIVGAMLVTTGISDPAKVSDISPYESAIVRDVKHYAGKDNEES